MKKVSISFALYILLITLSFSQPSKVDVPEWLTDAIFYQIFPERFANGDTTNDPANKEVWGAIPKYYNYFGGDLKGVIDKLDYIESLGVNAIYFNPIFESNSNHKYHTKDYFKIDPHFGDDATFKQLIDECHKRGIKVVIDGVFNHTGTDFFAFEDIVKNEKNSKYLHWFKVHSFPVQLPPAKPNYEAWWGLGELPKLMADEPDVKKYLFDATRKWTEMGIDGWRLDVPNEMSHGFWVEWRKLVKSINPNCYIVGEIWEDASPWLKGDQFDAVMNYLFRDAVNLYFVFNKLNTKQFDSLLAIPRKYPTEVQYALQNLVGSHDTERFLTLTKGNTAKAKLSALLQMTYIGAPMIYYGDEIGMMGGRDPDCRRTMIWDTLHWNFALLDFYKKVIKIRNENPVFRHGSYKTILTDNEKNLFGFIRDYENEKVIVILNNTDKCQSVNLPTPDKKVRVWEDVLNNKIVKTLKNNQLYIEDILPYGGVILISRN
ncbi:MAG: glycoside hydrolase family 13 protein [Bacteroidetes bacterium]|nr:glycoside hydrolase family 13 protein [Bacteroidota bacterium]MBU1421709.1 glycoside hydrolase family 13 protein [Bacteroidota bacterium]MBU2636728.1 glycoside hydrolase family 13 protein [Bacteroidota bacterium]